MPWTAIHAKIHTLLKTTSLLPKDTAILMGVSGGQDSLCLAKLLLDLQPKWNWQLAVVHCDHGWRSDSADNAAHVANLVRQWQLPYFVATAPELPKTEAAARSWRYGIFAELASTHSYCHVVTGHTATDRAETVLYNLLRGSGADGVQALSWQRPLSTTHQDVYVTRPLLQLTRQETGLFCRELALPVWQDASNENLHYRRNRIRQELMPYLRSHFNPNVETTLAQTAEIFTAEVTYLEAQSQQLYSEVINRMDQNGWRMRRLLLRAAPLALQRRVVRQLLQRVLPQQPTFDHIEKLVALANAPNRTQTDPFPGGLIARVEHDWITLQ
ncbi:tRNA lysidine(34) synthetase TilS [Leptolyngbyaceae cyanobacterium CCMR0082]|uniref:tRNA(Ile)-lysidine synthase n=1 Tax=Adonisia turfae CCMR0082 TaxID=2304604 RepID=A0A6M0SBJ5_9CYAN|nr:tRNA lysidine(34) synthetase TilS [Adonisia turfae]NEZ65042.1 tRNA lysidine(34) synthetase TilS [Adonisia turfae CCMR0082]